MPNKTETKNILEFICAKIYYKNINRYLKSQFRLQFCNEIIDKHICGPSKKKTDKKIDTANIEF
jgi:hypothetical protein